MKKGDIQRGLRGLIESPKVKVLLILWLLYWPIVFPKLLNAFALDVAGIIIYGGPVLLLGGIISWFLYCDFLRPCHELLVKKALIERTVHVNWAKYWQSPRGLGSCGVKTCEIREGLSYHKPIPDDMIVNNRLTIGYLPKACIILYVQKPEA
ncbi:MAG: hypothetical protein IJ438_08585 [Clostridia bacterium]|nr:hypothetical protein [Clostridia bacterium]